MWSYSSCTWARKKGKVIHLFYFFRMQNLKSLFRLSFFVKFFYIFEEHFFHTFLNHFYYFAHIKSKKYYNKFFFPKFFLENVVQTTFWYLPPWVMKPGRVSVYNVLLHLNLQSRQDTKMIIEYFTRKPTGGDVWPWIIWVLRCGKIFCPLQSPWMNFTVLGFAVLIFWLILHVTETCFYIFGTYTKKWKDKGKDFFDIF